MALSATIDQDNKFDKTQYTVYVTAGKFVDYVVWPCVLIQDGGSLMRKGVAECCDKAPETLISIE